MKKLISLSLVITIILSLFTVTANAATDWLKLENSSDNEIRL